ncbi:hypothetical protein PR048_006718 [Dryococelus australis]|uniref:Uncharacterized protein n=1 Tax=Dryococelus australis TaxID=614101 RepID=A0ABQ9IBQ9_9NEOP|nr:hypothetical protein PR048_006718 [Dryococelus australis]
MAAARLAGGHGSAARSCACANFLCRHRNFNHNPRRVAFIYSSRATKHREIHATQFVYLQGDPGSIPGRVTPDFRMWESCRMMPLAGGSSRGSPVSSASSFRRCSMHSSLTLIGSQDPVCGVQLEYIARDPPHFLRQLHTSDSTSRSRLSLGWVICMANPLAHLGHSNPFGISHLCTALLYD